MNFEEQLNEINSLKNLEDVAKEFDFIKDYENLRLEKMFNTHQKRKRRTNFSDSELEYLYDVFNNKVDEISNNIISKMSYNNRRVKIMGDEEEVCFKKFEYGKTFDEELTLSEFQFTGWALNNSEYFVVNMNRESEFIGKEIINDLKKSDGKYFEEDIIAHVEILTDKFKKVMVEKVSDYLNSNW